MLEGEDVWASMHGRSGASEAGRGWKWPTALIEAAIAHGQRTIVGATMFLRLSCCCTPPLPLLGVSIGMEKGCQ